MKPNFVGTFLVVIFVGLSVYLRCSKISNNNPIDPRYDGVYRLKLIEKDIADDTLQVLRTYAIACSTGADTFLTYQFAPSCSGSFVVDTVIFSGGKHVDTIRFCGIRPFAGSAFIRAIRPNGRIDSAAVPLTVVSHYRIAEKDTIIAGLRHTLFVRYSGVSQTPAESLDVQWSMKPELGAAAGPLEAPFEFLTPKDAPDGCVAYATLKDKRGHSIALDPFIITIIHPPSPKMDSVKLCDGPTLGSKLKLVIKHSGNDTSHCWAFAWLQNPQDTAKWRDNSPPIRPNGWDTVQFIEPLLPPVLDTGEALLNVYVVNRWGLISDTMTVKTKITCAMLPVVRFPMDSFELPLNVSSQVSVSSMPEANRYVWKIDALKADTVDSCNRFISLNDTFPHKLSVCGLNRFGYAGKTESIPIRAKRYSCLIAPKSFPGVTKAKKWTAWIAGVSDTIWARQRNAKFKWTVSPPNYDSLKTMGAAKDTLMVYWRDTAATVITITVVGDSGETCASFMQGIYVKRFPPHLTFKERGRSMGTTDSVACAVSVADSNADGTIDSIFWTRGGKTPAAFRTRDSIVWIKSTLPDTFWITARVRDNDGFFSAPDSEKIMIRAYRPYMLPQMPDTTVFVNSIFTFRASGHVSDTSAAIAAFLWDFNGDGSWDDSSSGGEKAHSFGAIGLDTVIVKCRDSKGMESVPDTFIVNVGTGEPILSRITARDTTWFDDTVTYALSAVSVNPIDSISGYFVRWDSASAFVGCANPSIKRVYSFPDSGRHIARFYVQSKLGLLSDTLADTVYVNPDVPFLSIKLDTCDNCLFVKDARACTVTVRPMHGAVDSIVVLWGDSTAASVQTGTIQTGTVFFHSYPINKPGLRTITAMARNTKGVWSDGVKKDIAVHLGKPLVVSMSPETVWVNDDTLFTIGANDTNGNVDSISIDWGDQTVQWIKRSGSTATIAVPHKYGISQFGLKTVKVLCKDDDGLLSDSTFFKVFVRQGRPKIPSFALNGGKADSLYFKDLISLSVKYADSNGVVDSIAIDSATGTFSAFRKVDTDSQYIFTRRFDFSDEAGGKTLRVKVKDRDGVVSDTVSLPITVRKGIPVITAVAHSSPTMWVRDLNSFMVTASDSNGFIRKIFVNWDGGSTPQETVNVGGNQSVYTATFNHAWDSSVTKTALFWALDEDDITSSQWPDNFTIHKGVPVLWGDGPNKDTLWVVVDKDYGTYYYRPNHNDSNGVIQRYYFGSNSDTNAAFYKGPLDSAQYAVTDLVINKGATQYIFGRDDDQYIGGGKFIVYADSAPPMPDIIATNGDGGVKLMWSGKDVKDGDATQYRILLKQGVSPTNTDVLQNYKAGTLYTAGDAGYQFKFAFTGGTTGSVYKYKIIAKDARGTESASTEQSFIYP